MKKLFALSLLIPLIISCSSKQKSDFNPDYVKDTNGFDILMGQFAHNIENIWGIKEVLIAGPKDYVKYTDEYRTRSHINFDAGTITVETISAVEPSQHLKKAIVTTLLMGTTPIPLTSILISMIFLTAKNPFYLAKCSITQEKRFVGNGEPQSLLII